MARRLNKTLIDYLVIAISPALIMTLVGSLVFFLIVVFYEGHYDGVLHYIMGLFVFAAVLIARIAIEEGRERAYLFIIPLAIVTLLAVGRFAEAQGLPLVVILIGVIWWCADKLVWDCTLIDEQERDSGEGLLEVVGLDKPAPAASGPAAPAAEEKKGIEGVTSRDVPAVSWWERLIQRRRRPHAPGVWIVYFSLAALPLFGVGQLLIPASWPGTRQYAFGLLFVYVASGLGLLLTTSFLGLRRYLRQRRVAMPATMASMWLTIGSVLIVALLALVALLPRPCAGEPISWLVTRFDSPRQESSKFGTGSVGAEEDQGGSHTGEGDESEEGEEGEKGSRSANNQNQGGPGSEEKEDRDEASSGATEDEPGQGSENESNGQAATSGNEEDEGGQGDSTSTGRSDEEESSSPDEEKESDESEEEQGRGRHSGSSGGGRGHEGGRRSDQRGQSGSQAPQKDGRADNPGQRPRSETIESPQGLQGGVRQILGLLKWVFYAALVLVAVYWLWRSRANLAATLGGFLQGWREFWQNLFGRRRREADRAAAAEDSPKQPVLRPLAAFADPFATGVAGRYSPDELVQYSFEAVEAWAREHGCAREPDQTPHEFARNVGAREASLVRDARMLADLYCQVAYAPGTVAAASVERLKPLWYQLRVSGTAAKVD